MTRIVLEHDAAKLQNVSGRVEVCDPSGRMLGYFLPAEDRSLYEGAEPSISEDELRRRSGRKDGYSTAEVLAYLKSLEGGRETP